MSYLSQHAGKIEPEKRVHYVAHLKIEKVEQTADPNVEKGKRTRLIDEVTQINLSDKQLSALVKKLGLLLGIVARDFEDDPTRGGND